MGLNIKSIGNFVQNFNSKGATLLKKETGLNIKNAINEGIKIPQRAKTYDTIRVGRNFNPKESYTDIFTFRDKTGKIISRHTKKVDGKNIIEQKKNFIDLNPWEKDLDEFGDEILNINGRRIRSFTRENGKISKISEEVFSTTDETKPFLTHFKREITPANDTFFKKANIENILLEERRNGEKAKFIKNQYITELYDTGSFNLVNTNASSPKLKKLAQNTYFLPYISNNHKFANRMASANVKDAQFNFVDPDIYLYKNKSNQQGYFSSSGEVHINLKSSKDLARPRISLTETIGHEVGHAKWEEKCALYDLYKAGLDDGLFLKTYSDKDISNIKKYKYSIENYITPENDYKEYIKQFCEKTAQKEGCKSAKKYKKFEDDLNKEFQNMHGYQFYEPEFFEDDMQGLMTFLRTLI